MKNFDDAERRDLFLGSSLDLQFPVISAQLRKFVVNHEVVNFIRNFFLVETHSRASFLLKSRCGNVYF